MRKSCGVCGEEFDAKRPSAKYCGERCKKRAQRRPGGVTAPRAAPVTDLPVELDDGPLTAATRAELAAAGREVSAAGQRALAAARRIDNPMSDTGSAIASLMRAQSDALAEALKDATPADDALDELRARRDRKHAG